MITTIGSAVFIGILALLALACNSTPEPTPTSTSTPTLISPEESDFISIAPIIPPTAVPTSPPTVPLTELYDILPENIQIIQGEINHNDRLVLVGCHAQRIPGVGNIFTNDGDLPFSYPENSIAPGVVLVHGYVRGIDKGQCYEMAVEYVKTEQLVFGVAEDAAVGLGESVRIRTYRTIDEHAMRRIWSIKEWQDGNQ